MSTPEQQAKDFREALEKIADLLPWTETTSEQMRQIAEDALALHPNTVLGHTGAKPNPTNDLDSKA